MFKRSVLAGVLFGFFGTLANLKWSKSHIG